MLSRNKAIIAVLLAATLLSPIAACGAAATPTTVPPTAAPKAATANTGVPPTAEPTKAPATATAVPPSPTPAPTTGGTLVRGTAQEPDTLDVHKTTMVIMDSIMSLVGAALVARDPSTGKTVPYLADSWAFSPDGLTWTFKLHAGVKFHDGTPLTAQDYAWTFSRALDPATKSLGTANMLSSLKSAEATDAQTLVLHLKTPFYYLLLNLASASFASPMPQAAVTKAGDKWGRAPISCGPYKFVSWETGRRIILQRASDYRWAPSWYTGSGPYIDEIEFRFLPDITTVQMGIESGEIDFAAIQTKDVSRTKATGTIALYSTYRQGNGGYVLLNNSVPALSDPAVRKALSYAVDRSAMIQIVWNGDAIAASGPLSPPVAGYDKVQETYALPFDLAKSKSTLADAGYTAGPDGIMQKNGVKLTFAMSAASGDEKYLNMSQVLQQQWKAIGVHVDIVLLEPAILVSNLNQIKYEAIVMASSNASADMLYIQYGSKAIGGGNRLNISDPTFDQLLLATRTTLDPARQQDAVNAVCKYLLDGAYMITLGAGKEYTAVNSRVKGFSISQVTNEPDFLGAYIAK